MSYRVESIRPVLGRIGCGFSTAMFRRRLTTNIVTSEVRPNPARDTPVSLGGLHCIAAGDMGRSFRKC